MFRTSSSLKLIAGSLFSVFYKTVEGKILSFTIGVHCKVKKLFFKKYAFLKFVTILLSITSGGIKGIFVLL